MGENYKNIKELIEINEGIKKSCEDALKEIQEFLLNQSPKGYNKGTSYLDADCIHGGKIEIGEKMLEKVAENAGLLRNTIEQQEKVLKVLKSAKNDIDRKLRDLEGTRHKVAYLKLVEGYTLQMIADELGLSLGHIKNLSSKI